MNYFCDFDQSYFRGICVQPVKDPHLQRLTMASCKAPSDANSPKRLTLIANEIVVVLTSWKISYQSNQTIYPGQVQPVMF